MRAHLRHETVWVVAFAWSACAAMGCKKNSSPSTPQSAVDASVPADAPPAPAPRILPADAETAFLPDSSDEQSCVSICMRRAKELKCAHPELCRGACAKLRDARYCVREVRAFVACFTKTPREQWGCNDDGMPIVAGYACEGEQGGMADCLVESEGKL
jgi:hypothetical protein